jgi:hypothetical protein
VKRPFDVTTVRYRIGEVATWGTRGAGKRQTMFG